MQAAQLLPQQDRERYGQRQHQRSLAPQAGQGNANQAAQGVAEHYVARLRQRAARVAKQQHAGSPQRGHDQHLAAQHREQAQQAYGRKTARPPKKVTPIWISWKLG
jgi:hypothetical protein